MNTTLKALALLLPLTACANSGLTPGCEGDLQAECLALDPATAVRVKVVPRGEWGGFPQAWCEADDRYCGDAEDIYAYTLDYTSQGFYLLVLREDKTGALEHELYHAELWDQTGDPDHGHTREGWGGL